MDKRGRRVILRLKFKSVDKSFGDGTILVVLREVHCMGPVLADFVNEKYLVLKALYDHQVCVGGETFAPLSQQEIAGLVGFARPKTISILQALIDKGYVSVFCGMRGKYVVTKDGLWVIAYFENSGF